MSSRFEQSILSCLDDAGVSHAFGVPGSQNVALYDAAFESSLTLVTLNDELAAGFAAVGFGRISGSPSILLTIPGPGLTYTIPALAEAMHDNVPLIMLTPSASESSGNTLQLQALDESRLLAPVSKGVISVDRGSELRHKVGHAVSLATSELPGPVVLLLHQGSDLGSKSVEKDIGIRTGDDAQTDRLGLLAQRMHEADSVLFFVGHTADRSAQALLALAEKTGARVMSTPGARGVFPESHANCVRTDGCDPDKLNELISSFALVVTFGVKLSHSNTIGFRLRLPADKTVHITTDNSLIGAAADAGVLSGSASEAIRFLLLEAEEAGVAHAVKAAERSTPAPIKRTEPRIKTAKSEGLADFFSKLRDALPNKAILVCDSGSHQFFARRHYTVERPGGLLFPAEFQSMGFALPAAIGANVAEPDTPLAVVIGDGGIQISGMLLARMASFGLSMPVFVFCDGRFGLIHERQTNKFGRTVDTDLPGIDLRALAAATSCHYERYDGNMRELVSQSLQKGTPTLVEVGLEDAVATALIRNKVKLKRTLSRLLRSS